MPYEKHKQPPEGFVTRSGRKIPLTNRDLIVIKISNSLIWHAIAVNMVIIFGLLFMGWIIISTVLAAIDVQVCTQASPTLWQQLHCNEISR